MIEAGQRSLVDAVLARRLAASRGGWRLVVSAGAVMSFSAKRHFTKRQSFTKRQRWCAPPILPAALVGLSVAAFAPSARADAVSWFSVAGGVGAFPAGEARRFPGAFQLELGLGSTPASPVVIGGVFKTLTYFTKGTDLAFTLRAATGGFARGGFGLAVDAGGYERWWSDGSQGFLGALVLGGPYGLQLTALTEQGTNDVRMYAATFGIDLLRLTVYRNASGGYWPNPMLAPVQALR